MLVGGGVVDEVGMIKFEDLLHAGLVLDVGDDEGHAVELVVIGVLQLKLQVVHGAFGLVEHNDLSGLVAHQLTADFAADGAGGAGDKHHLVDHLAHNVDVVHLDGLALKQVFNLDVLNLVGREASVEPQTHVGRGLDREAQVEGAVGDGLLVKYADGGDGDDELAHLLLFDKLGYQHRADTHDGHAIEFLVDLRHIVVDKGHNMIFGAEVLMEGIIGNDAGGTGTIDDHILDRTTTAEKFVIHSLQCQALDNHQHSQHRVEHEGLAVGEQDVDRDEGRTQLVVNQVDHNIDDCGTDGGEEHIHNVAHASVANDASVAAADEEEYQRPHQGDDKLGQLEAQAHPGKTAVHKGIGQKEGENEKHHVEGQDGPFAYRRMAVALHHGERQSFQYL